MGSLKGIYSDKGYYRAIGLGLRAWAFGFCGFRVWRLGAYGLGHWLQVGCGFRISFSDFLRLEFGCFESAGSGAEWSVGLESSTAWNWWASAAGLSRRLRCVGIEGGRDVGVCKAVWCRFASSIPHRVAQAKEGLA